METRENGGVSNDEQVVLQSFAIANLIRRAFSARPTKHTARLKHLQLIGLVLPARAIRREHATERNNHRHDAVDPARAVLLAGQAILILILAD